MSHAPGLPTHVEPPTGDLLAAQPRLRLFLTDAQAQEATSAATAPRSLEGTAQSTADSSLAILRDIVWSLLTEYASSYLCPCLARLGADPRV
eukprot:13552998-Alexandrium_andersonii.AAC.1